MAEFAIAAPSAGLKTRADFKAAEGEADRLLRDLCVEKPPVDPVAIAEQLGVGVVFVEFDAASRSVSGFYDAEERSIYVNKAEYPFRQTFTVAHELGHHLLHQQWAQSSEYKVLLRDQEGPSDFYEQEANAFAAHLLVPKKMLDSYKSVASVSELSQLFLVSVPVIRNRLAQEGRRA